MFFYKINKNTFFDKNIFLIGGKTGGPLIPLLAINNNLKQTKPIIIGIKNSFEQVYATKNNLKILYLPEIKFSSSSFKDKSFILEIILKIVNLILILIGGSFSLLLSLINSIKFKPKLAITAGSFLAVPQFFAIKITNFLKITNCKLVVHQQDPLLGLANKLLLPIADKLTYTFDYTKNTYPIYFKKSQKIPNPIDYQKYDLNLELIRHKLKNINLELFKFLEPKLFFSHKNQLNKPLLLIFGGGSGSEKINNWVKLNLNKLVKKYFVIHLTGALYGKNIVLQNNTNSYFKTQFLLEEMHMIMFLSDLVICRSGLGSITELLYLQKQAFLIPIANSHQEVNAKVVADKFNILEEKNEREWLNVILNYRIKKDSKNNQNNKIDIQNKLNEYYEELNKII